MDKAIKLRTIFMGTSSFAEEILKALIGANYNIVAVFTQPDKPAGRGREIKKSPVKILSENSKIPVFQPAKFDEETVKKIKKIKPDIIIVTAYGRILPGEVLETPGFGCLNIHASLLPKFRGPSPIQNTLMAGEKETGITVILMNEGVDTGDVLLQEKIKINPDDTTETLAPKLSALGAKLLLKTVPLWVEREIKPEQQDDSQASLCQLIERGDGRLVWEDEAENIYNKFRAFCPWPGIFTFWESGDGAERLKLRKISLQKTDPQEKHKSGEVFQLGDKIGVQTLKGVIILEEIQIEGKKPMPVKDFINGYPAFVGSVLQ